MVSCNNEEDFKDLQSQTTTVQKNSVFIITDDTVQKTNLTGVNDPQTIAFGINKAVDTDTNVVFKVQKNGNDAIEGTDYTISPATITANETNATTDVTFLTEGDYKVFIESTDNATLQIAPNYFLYKVLPPTTFTITWSDSFYDYDLYLLEGNQDINGNIIAFSNGTTTTESFSAVPKLGFNSVYILDYLGDNAGTPVTLTIDDGTIHTYDISMDMSKFVLTIEASVDANNNVVYNYTQL